MNEHAQTRCIAFEGDRRIAAGELADIVPHVKEAVDRDGGGAILVFDDDTSEVVEVDTRGTVQEILKRIAPRPRAGDDPAASGPAESAAPRGPGRPKLGVVAREVTLLPRHWEWLGGQPGGASVALRKLVEEARRANAELDRKRLAQESAYRFLSTMAGDRPGFEEATRALFAGDRERFDELVEPWPADVRDHARTLASRTLDAPPGAPTPRTPPPRS